MSEPSWIESPSFDAALRRIEELERDLLDARRELDEARGALRWTWREEGLIEKDLPDVILAAFLAARAAEGGGGGGDE